LVSGGDKDPLPQSLPPGEGGIFSPAWGGRKKIFSRQGEEYFPRLMEEYFPPPGEGRILSPA